MILYTPAVQLFHKKRSKKAKIDFHGSYIIWPMFGHFHLYNPSHKDHYFPFDLHFQKLRPRSSKKALSFLCFANLDQPAAKDDGDDDESDDLAYLNQPADDLGQLDDDDGDGDGDEEDQGGGEEEEDQLEEHGVEQRVHAEAEVVWVPGGAPEV